MADPEIDEAAAMEWFESIAAHNNHGNIYGNAARAALRWKSRAEAAEKLNREWEDNATTWMAFPEAAARLDGYRELGAKLAAAEAERDSLRRQLAQAVKARVSCIHILGWERA